MGLVMNLNIAAVATTTLLLAALIWTYASMLRQAPSRFTWGLLLFAVALWSQAAVQLYFFATMMDYYAGGVEGLVLVQNVLALVASGVLLAVTMRPVGAGKAQPAES